MMAINVIYRHFYLWAFRNRRRTLSAYGIAVVGHLSWVA